MSALVFHVTFHEAFLVRSGFSADGLDAVARPSNPLPASSLKGAMRHACADVLGVPQALVADIFGQEGRLGGRFGQGAWAWTDAEPTSAFTRLTRARNRVDAETGVVHPEALSFSEEYWQKPGSTVTFAVEELRTLPPEVTERHTVVLQASAWAVTGLGSWRNRSMGTVTVRPSAAVPDLARKLGEVCAP